ncbi:ABC transporter substrate-binding protein [Thaumasiovibrio subtropicus]|uniref:ABC transporter substrate-binding protein n=1 Tax=Thaumasiovibrio subtropicus TaxID=1891207 RepID=UPI000B35E053|nr:ABC transporter substrate-binding protein [Thaumasiovibrio subtropicus]
MAKWLSIFSGFIFMCSVYAQSSQGISSQHLVILTSFPESFYSPIQTQFEQSHPHVAVRVINKKTPALIAHLKQDRSPKADLVWLSSADAMAQLQLHGQVSDAYTFAWSQFGFFWDQSRLAALNLPRPDSWETLLQPQFRHQVAMSAPSRSGTNHLIIELILQQYGWEEGWKLLLQLGGNLSTITARSFGVREGILRQRFTVAPVVDFFYRSALAQGANVAFQPMRHTPLIPAQVGLTAHKDTHPKRQQFVDFLLSDQGQAILSLPQVSRISLTDAKQLSAYQPEFDAVLSASRYNTVNALFDQWITHRLEGLHTFWARWHALNNQALTKPQRIELHRIVDRLMQIPVDESVASDPTLNRQLSASQKYDAFYQRITQNWQTEMHTQLTEAMAVLATIESEVTQ